MRWIVGVLCVLLIGGAVYALVQMGSDDGQATTDPLAISEEISTPRPTPAWPMHTPPRGGEGGVDVAIQLDELGERSPTSTPIPTPTPSPTPPDTEAIYIASWASCNGQYEGVEYQGRREAAESAIARGLRRPEDLADLVNRSCDGVFIDPTVATASEGPRRVPGPTATPATATRTKEGSWFVSGPDGTWVMRYVDHTGDTRQLLMPQGWSPPDASPIGERPTPTVAPRPTNTPWVGAQRPYPTSTPEPTLARVPTPTPTRRPEQTAVPTPTIEPRTAGRSERDWPRPSGALAHRTGASRLDQVINWAWTARNHPEVTDRIRQTPWATDGLLRYESDALGRLLALVALGEPDDARDLLDMPFMRRPDTRTPLALATMVRLRNGDQDAYETLWRTDRMRAGLTTPAAGELAALTGLFTIDAETAGTLLDAGALTVEESRVTSADGRTVRISIYRTGPARADTMEQARKAVLTAEWMTGAALPTDEVIIMYDDRGVTHGHGGTNYGNSITIKRSSEHAGPSGTTRRAATLAHEVAHYYWSGNRNWLDEGLADLAAGIQHWLETGDPVEPTRPPCAHYESIQKLERAGPPHSTDGFRCNYSFGQRVAIDLWARHGADASRDALRELITNAWQGRGDPIGHEDLAQAFGDRETVDRWYLRGGPAGLGPAVGGTPQPDLHQINGRITQFRATLTTRTLIELITAYRHEGDGGSEKVTLRVGYEDGMTFWRSDITITADPRYAGATAHSYIPTEGRFRQGRYWATATIGGRLLASTEWEIR